MTQLQTVNLHRAKFLNQLIILPVYFGLLIMVAVCTPITPDELNRYYAVAQGQTAKSAWAPLTFVPTIVGYVFFSEYTAVTLTARVFNIWCLLGLFYLAQINFNSYKLVLTLPCAAVCVLASPQLITLLLFFMIITKQQVTVGLIIAPLGSGIIGPIYFTYISILTIVRKLFFPTMERLEFRRIFRQLGVYIVSALLFTKMITGEFGLFFETQSALNNFKLGNNTEDFSPFGNKPISSDVESGKDILGYVSENLGLFLAQWLTKLAIYFSPIDTLKGFDLGLLFNVVLVCAWLILLYAVLVFFKSSLINNLDTSRKYLILIAASGIVYALFTVKYRYRAPFEMLFYISLFLTHGKSKN